MDNMIDYRYHTGARPDKFFKSTLFQSARLLLGLNCLEPGQEQFIPMPTRISSILSSRARACLWLEQK
jgi:hypothetical protein